ncbi:hypothetical protein [Legionella genomosp. 1]|uniref:hypothetical protein n=1 Tax=Legionella genomosp. 1 TaxID=1093625 RepID=UPI001054B582|nr:hypothetical protein [Legionella genomosp. 1]
MIDYQLELKKLNQLIKDAEIGVLPITQTRLATLYDTRSMLCLYLYINPSTSISQIRKLPLPSNFSIDEIDNDPQKLKQKLQIQINHNLGIYSDLDLIQYMLLQLQPFISQNPVFAEFFKTLEKYTILENQELTKNLLSFGNYMVDCLKSRHAFSYEEQHVILNLAQICKNRRFFQERRYLWPFEELHPDPNDLESPFNARNVRPPLHRLLQAVSFSIVYVSSGFGSGPGLGHTLLHLGEDKGYVHINGLYNYPIYISDAHFRDFYLDKWQKRVVAIQKVHVPNPDAAMSKLVQLCQTTWLWGGPLHNCFHFCKQVLLAGGASLKEIEGLCVPNHRVLQQAMIDFSPLDLSQWTPPDYVQFHEPDSNLQMFKSRPIQEWTINPQQRGELLEQMISHLGNLYVWQKPLQKARLKRKLEAVHKEIEKSDSAPEGSLSKRERIIQKMDQLDMYTAKAVVRSLIEKIISNSWPLKLWGGTVVNIVPAEGGDAIQKTVPRNMARMISIYQKHLMKGNVDYISILNEICFIGYMASLENNSRWTAYKGRHDLTRNFYQLFNQMIKVNFDFNNHTKATDAEPPKELEF